MFTSSSNNKLRAAVEDDGGRTRRERLGRYIVYDKDPLMRSASRALAWNIASFRSIATSAASALPSISFNVGGTQDIGFRNEMAVVFNALPSRAVSLRVKDENGQPRHGRLHHPRRPEPALSQSLQTPRARPVFPASDLPGRWRKRPAACRELYRHMHRWARSICPTTRKLAVRSRRSASRCRFGWHAGSTLQATAGIPATTTSTPPAAPTTRIPPKASRPKNMIRQIHGERLNVGSVLTWGPGYYHQKRYFSGKDDPNPKHDSLMHYDLEVSGFPSSHAGHLVLLGLKQQDYPGTKRSRTGPPGTCPSSAGPSQQGAVVGFAHSGWGLQSRAKSCPTTRSRLRRRRRQ